MGRGNMWVARARSKRFRERATAAGGRAREDDMSANQATI